VRRGVPAAGGDAQSAPDRVCASWGGRVMRGWEPVCVGAIDTAVSGLCHSASEPSMCRLLSHPILLSPFGHLCALPPLARRSATGR
jgi:hypothetical protein